MTFVACILGAVCNLELHGNGHMQHMKKKTMQAGQVVHGGFHHVIMMQTLPNPHTALSLHHLKLMQWTTQEPRSCLVSRLCSMFHVPYPWTATLLLLQLALFHGSLQQPMRKQLQSHEWAAGAGSWPEGHSWTGGQVVRARWLLLTADGGLQGAAQAGS